MADSVELVNLPLAILHHRFSRNSQLFDFRSVHIHVEYVGLLDVSIVNFTPSFPEICREAPNDFRIKIIDQSKLTAKKINNKHYTPSSQPD